MLLLSSPPRHLHRVPAFPLSVHIILTHSLTLRTPKKHQPTDHNANHIRPQHYELIPQTTLQTAEASLRSELAPAITTLLDRADAHVDRVDRRIESLRARAELQQGRLDNSPSSSSSSSRNNPRAKTATGTSGGANLDGSAKLRARVLKQRREALQYSVERLELEVLQKERELRKRLDVT